MLLNQEYTCMLLGLCLHERIVVLGPEEQVGLRIVHLVGLGRLRSAGLTEPPRGGTSLRQLGGINDPRPADASIGDVDWPRDDGRDGRLQDDLPGFLMLRVTRGQRDKTTVERAVFVE